MVAELLRIVVLVRGPVQLSVEDEELLHVTVRFDLFLELHEAVDVVSRERGHALGQKEWLEPLADLVAEVAVALIELADPRSSV